MFESVAAEEKKRKKSLLIKKSYFASTYSRKWQVFENFASTYFCEWQVYKFQPQSKKNSKKTVESRDIWPMFLSRSTERQAVHYGKTVVID